MSPPPDKQNVTAQRRAATLGLGSNLGDKCAHIDQAIALLKGDRQIEVMATSRKYRSPPWGDLDQDWFVNACVRIQTTLSPHELLRRCQSVEDEMGRVRLRKWGPRVIDVDILTYASEVIHDPDLILPHPFISERPFVLVPLAEIAPELKFHGRSIVDLVALADRSGLEPISR